MNQLARVLFSSWPTYSSLSQKVSSLYTHTETVNNPLALPRIPGMHFFGAKKTDKADKVGVCYLIYNLRRDMIVKCLGISEKGKQRKGLRFLRGGRGGLGILSPRDNI